MQGELKCVQTQPTVLLYEYVRSNGVILLQVGLKFPRTELGHSQKN